VPGVGGAHYVRLYDGVFKPALRAVGLPVSEPGTAGVRLHDLRHTFAVLSLSAGEHYRRVSQMLGHAKYTMTLDVYGGYIPRSEGGKAAPLARPAAPAPTDTPTNVISLAERRRSAGRSAPYGPESRGSSREDGDRGSRASGGPTRGHMGHR